MLKRHLALRARLQLQGLINHEDLFFRDNGRPIRDLNHPYDRWRWTLRVTLKARYREPYNARHSCVSWNLMLGKNLLWVAKLHGHSVQTMLDVYAAWIEGSKESALEAIRLVMDRASRARERGGRSRPTAALLQRQRRMEAGPPRAPRAPEFGTGTDPDQPKLRNALRIVWWKGRDSNPRPRHYECRALTS